MNGLQGQRGEMFMDKNVSACHLPEIAVCNNYKELTYNVVKDICVDEGVPTVQENFLFNKKDSVVVNANALESKSSDEEFVDTEDSIKLVVTGDDCEVYHEVGCEKSPSKDVTAKSGSVIKEALTLGDIISMDDSHKPRNKNSIYEAEENIGREIEQRKTGERKSVSWRYLPTDMVEPKNQLVNNVLQDSYDHHHLFSSSLTNEFSARSFSEAESGLAHITYSGPISIAGSISVRSDGSTASTHSFAFPILQSEWNSSPIKMVKAEKRQLRKEKGWRHYSLLLCCRF